MKNIISTQSEFSNGHMTIEAARASAASTQPAARSGGQVDASVGLATWWAQFQIMESPDI